MSAFIGITVAVAVLLVLGYWAVLRSRKKASSARAKSRSNELLLMQTMSDVVKSTPQRVWTPDEIERREKIAAAFGETAYFASTDSVRVAEPVKAAPLIKPIPQGPLPVSLPVAPRNVVEPAAAPLSVSEALLVEDDLVAVTAGNIAERLRLLADKVEGIAAAGDQSRDRADKIMLTIAREWAALPLASLEDAGE